MNDTLVELTGVSKSYRRGSEEVHALKDVSLSIARASYISVVGRSGSGKTTLLNMIGCVDVPSSGLVIVGGREVESLSEAELAKVRLRMIGFVFQQFFLLPTLTAIENVILPGMFRTSLRERKGLRVRGLELLVMVGLEARANHRPSELSGGEMQRVAIARALVNEPDLILADEPTGNLDDENAESVLAVFDALNSQGQTIVLVTHDKAFSLRTERVIHLYDGRIAK
jgi:putative ABC transport system ATP-binding protein